MHPAFEDADGQIRLQVTFSKLKTTTKHLASGWKRVVFSLVYTAAGYAEMPVMRRYQNRPSTYVPFLIFCGSGIMEVSLPTRVVSRCFKSSERLACHLFPAILAL